MAVISLFPNVQAVNQTIANGDFFRHQELLELVSYVRLYKQNFHMVGLVSRSKRLVDLDHWVAGLQFAAEQKIEQLYIQVITDGVDMPPTSAESVLDWVSEQMKRSEVGRLASICGRYYAIVGESDSGMVKQIYAALVEGKGKWAVDYGEALRSQYERGVTDEFIEPTLLTEDKGKDTAMLIRPGDVVWLMNHNGEGMVELAKLLARVPQVKLVSLTDYKISD